MYEIKKGVSVESWRGKDSDNSIKYKTLHPIRFKDCIHESDDRMLFENDDGWHFIALTQDVNYTIRN